MCLIFATDERIHRVGNGLSYANFHLCCIFCWHGSMGFPPPQITIWKAFPGAIIRSSVAKIKQNLKITVFQVMGIKSKSLNQIQWSWYHSLLWKMLYLACKVLKISRSAFWGDTRYMLQCDSTFTPGKVTIEGRNMPIKIVNVWLLSTLNMLSWGLSFIITGKDCPLPPDSDVPNSHYTVDGQVSDSQGWYLPDTVLTYECEAGYHSTTHGTNQKTCLSGEWVGDAPNCGKCNSGCVHIRGGGGGGGCRTQMCYPPASTNL